MAKAEGPKAKPKPKLKLSDKEQSERFIEAARKLGVESSSTEFESAVEKILATKSHKRSDKAD